MTEEGLDHESQAPGPCGPSASERGPEQAAACPMRGICKGFAESSKIRYGIILIGALLIATGILILMQPNFLVWLAGSAAIVVGLLVVVAAIAARRFGGA
jgi:hypothetical protein